MKIQIMKNIVDTVDYLYGLIFGEGYTYDQVYQILQDNFEQEYTVNIVNETEDFFDVDVGLMNFTIYKDEEDGFRICENATYYIYGDNGEIEDTIDVEL